MMKKYLLLFISFFFCTFLFAENRIDNLTITVDLQKNGDAIINEVWQVYADNGTEWYVPKNNNGVSYSDFSVKDASGREFTFESKWNVDRNLKQKAGRCGLNPTRNGFELCWGIGEYGNQTYIISYRVNGIVVSLKDYDILHYQLINRGMGVAPRKVSVCYTTKDLKLNDSNSRIWGFGYNGTAKYEGGNALFESSEAFSAKSSMINLFRFNKGYFSPSVSENKTFDDHYAIAIKGASFSDDPEDDDDSEGRALLYFFIIAITIGTLCTALSNREIRKTYLGGVRQKDIDWYRDIPHDGNLEIADYVLTMINSKNNESATSAYILRMIYKGALTIQKDAKDRIEICFNDQYKGELSPMEDYIYSIMKEASGADGILQEKEFKRWASSHPNKVAKMSDKLKSAAKAELRSTKYKNGKHYTDYFCEQNRNLIGLKKFLIDFTEMKTKEIPEVHLWKEYMVYASLFNIADKVAKQLEKLVPAKEFKAQFEQQFPVNYTTFLMLNRHINGMSKSIVHATKVAAAGNGSRGGFGGSASFGGGGGFSGGGFGGGTR